MLSKHLDGCRAGDLLHSTNFSGHRRFELSTSPMQEQLHQPLTLKLYGSAVYVAALTGRGFLV